MVTTIYKRNEFPVINISGDDKIFIQDQIKHSLSKFGFLVIENNLIDGNLINECYQLAHQFFRLDSDIKRKYSARSKRSDDVNDIGYHHFLSETAIIAKKPDIKEFYHIGAERQSSSCSTDVFSENKWPEEIPGFKLAHMELWKKLSNLSILLLNHLATCLNLNHDYINDLMLKPNSILRSIYYPALSSALAEKGSVRAAQHTGINLIGLQCLATASGLEFFTPSKEWVCLKQGDFDDCISINMGEMIQYLTNNNIKATLHRVVNEQDVTTTGDRQAIVFFTHPDLSKPLIPNGSTDNTAGLIAGDWVARRLREIKTPELV
jgi:isopenicillin N synthase-like dioxygenase